jgi:hypothetical protein
MGIGGQEAYVFCPVRMYKPVPSRVGECVSATPLSPWRQGLLETPVGNQRPPPTTNTHGHRANSGGVQTAPMSRLHKVPILVGQNLNRELNSPAVQCL